MRALFAVPLMFALTACGTAEDTAIETNSLHEGAQVETCRLDDTICGGVVLHDMLGTPTLLKAYLIRRVGSTAVIDRMLELPNPNIQPEKEFTVVINNFAHTGNYYLAISLDVTTTRTGIIENESEWAAPEWTHESIAHATAEDFDRTDVRLRGNSWFEAQNHRLTQPVAIAETNENALGDPFIEIPNLRGRYDLEYIGWSDVFNLDGTATNVGPIELRLDANVPFDGHENFPTP